MSGSLYNKVITRLYDDGFGTTNLNGRFEGVQVGDGGADYSAEYYYDTYGRSLRVTGPGLPTHGAGSRRWPAGG